MIEKQNMADSTSFRKVLSRNSCKVQEVIMTVAIIGHLKLFFCTLPTQSSPNPQIKFYTVLQYSGLLGIHRKKIWCLTYMLNVLKYFCERYSSLHQKMLLVVKWISKHSLCEVFFSLNAHFPRRILFRP